MKARIFLAQISGENLCTTAMARVRPIRHAAVKRALSLAEEQGEAARLRWAMNIIKKYEKRMNSGDYIRAINAARDVPRRRRPKTVWQEVKELPEVPRTELKHVLEPMLGLLQNALKAHTILKTARAGFSMICTKADFLRVFGGIITVLESRTSGQLKAEIQEKSTKLATIKLAQILGLQAASDENGPNSRWFIRRYYGEDYKTSRTCAYIRVDPDHVQRKKITFKWRERKVKQITRDGEQKEASYAKLHVQFPRHSKSVAPKHRK